MNRVNIKPLWIPIIFLFLQSMIYLFIFSDNGYLYYKQFKKKLQIINAEIEDLDKQINELAKLSKHSENSTLALSKFVREFLLYTEDVKIIKFADQTKKPSITEKKQNQLIIYQKKYILYSSIAFIFTILISFLWNRKKQNV